MAYPHYDYCVVGGGPSGLTVAYKLLQKGQKVVLIERDPRIGGLCKSYQYAGHIFDIGPKRFHTEDPIVMDFIDHVVQAHVLRIDRSTKVYFTGKYFCPSFTGKRIAQCNRVPAISPVLPDTGG